MEEAKGKTKSTYQMCGDKGCRNYGWIPRLDPFKGAGTAGCSARSLQLLLKRQAWTRTHFITYPLFVPYIPLATPLLLRDGTRTRDITTKEMLICVLRKCAIISFAIFTLSDIVNKISSKFKELENLNGNQNYHSGNKSILNIKCLEKFKVWVNQIKISLFFLTQMRRSNKSSIMLSEQKSTK